jgi:hypothetical protein
VQTSQDTLSDKKLQNWPSWLKWAVLIQVSYAAFLGPYNCAVVNPSLVLLAKAFHVDPVTAAYNSTTAIIFGGVFVCEIFLASKHGFNSGTDNFDRVLSGLL